MGLTTAQQGLVHEPDVGETLLTRLRDVHLVAGKHVSIVLLDLGWEGAGGRAEWAGALHAAVSSSSFPRLRGTDQGCTQ